MAKKVKEKDPWDQAEEPKVVLNADGPKEVKPVKKRRKKRYILLYLAAIGFAFYAVITIITNIEDYSKPSAE